jgi:hypothetical protein
MLIQKSKIKQLIKEQGLRLSPDSFDGINRAVESVIKDICQNVVNDGMKTVMPQHTPIKKKVTVSTITKNHCNNCVNIKPEFIKFARSTQEWCHNKAVILSRKV